MSSRKRPSYSPTDHQLLSNSISEVVENSDAFQSCREVRIMPLCWRIFCTKLRPDWNKLIDARCQRCNGRRTRRARGSIVWSGKEDFAADLRLKATISGTTNMIERSEIQE